MKFSLELPREALSIPVIRRVLGDALRGLGVTEDCVSDILVATSEACTNVVQHAVTPVAFEVIAKIDDDICMLKISDTGRGIRGAAPAEVLPDPAELDTVSESGRGIRIMRAVVDDVSVDSEPERGTVVHLEKKLHWRDEALLRRLEHELMHVAK
jgi:serine/threonine-protein kinase RsbW